MESTMLKIKQIQAFSYKCVHEWITNILFLVEIVKKLHSYEILSLFVWHTFHFHLKSILFLIIN